MNGFNPRMMRAVTHYNVSTADCLAAASVLSEVVQPVLSLLMKIALVFAFAASAFAQCPAKDQSLRRADGRRRSGVPSR